MPLPSYDLREVRLSGDGENLSVQFKITSLAYDQPRANYNFYFYTEASHPGLPERLACSVGELYPVLFWELGCSLRMTIGQDMDVLNGYRVRTYDAPIDVQYSEGLVLTAIPYAWMSVESGDVLPYVSGQVMACGPTGTCVEVDEAHTSAQYVLP